MGGATSWRSAGALGGGSGIEFGSDPPASEVWRRIRPGCGDAEIRPRLGL